MDFERADLLQKVLSLQQIVHSRNGVYAEQNVRMDIFAKRLRERADQMGISNSEAARRAGLEERRYGHYIAGRREPDLVTLTKIAEVLQTTPNWLLGVSEPFSGDPKKGALVDRLRNAASVMTFDELELAVIQAEAIVATRHNGG